MEVPDDLPCNSKDITEDPLDFDELSRETSEGSEEDNEIEEEVLNNLQKTNLPNVNVPEKVIICLDVCYEDPNSLYRLGDGTTYSPINMLKRVLDFFVHSKHAINQKTEFALLIMNDTDACYVQNFTNNVDDIISAIDNIKSEENTSEEFDFQKIFQIIKQEIEIPEYKQSLCIDPPAYVVRMLVLYGRSNCIPVINLEDPYFLFLKQQPYLYMDILYAHEEDCATHKCEEVYDVLQELDNGYSYVFEVSRNATKIHDCIAKLLAHPLQRALQKDTDYVFS